MRYVYFMRPIGMVGPVKIGCSANPEERCRVLSRLHMPLEIAAMMPGDYFLERQLHTVFQSAHIGKEWFFQTDDLLAVIAEISAGTFDKAALPEKPVRLPRKAIEYTPERRAKMSEAARKAAENTRTYRRMAAIARASTDRAA